MVNKQNGKVLIVKRSCLTDRIVWVYHGTSEEAARKAYWRACKKEVFRIRNWMNKMIRRRNRLLSIITHGDNSSASSSAFKLTPPEKRKSARKIIQLAKEEPQPDREFYDHIIEESRRRNWASDRWKDNRIKMIRYGQTHAASEYQAKGKKNK